MKTHLKKKTLWIALVVLIFAVVQGLNHTGFCYAEARYLSDNELIDRAIFGPSADDLTFDEKVKIASTYKSWNSNMTGLDYPGCCLVNKRAMLIDPFWHFVDKTLLGRYVYQITMVYPLEKTSRGRHPFEESGFTVNSCGERQKGAMTIDIPEAMYLSTLTQNALRWKSSEN